MRKTKILFVTEFSELSTGYSVYTKNVLGYLHKVPNFEVAELACYVDRNNQAINNVPWKVYPNKPLKEDAEFAAYSGNTAAQFGDQSFNAVLLDFEPDIVMDIRDWWMFEFEQRSPFRDFFHWSIMPTVDAKPQDPQWVNTYATADSVFTYSEFGRDVLRSQCDDIKFIDIASPAADAQVFKPLDKHAHKQSCGLSGDSFIIGTVMRNQKRKLYPDLLASFRKILDETHRDDIFLYCHTYYPDIGWDIPSLLNDHNLSSRVLFTYKCKTCQAVTPDFFNDGVQICKNCGNFTNQLAGISNSVDSKQLADIYNLFDVYVQYANSEGFGMPQLEAAYCGLPVVSVNYSAMESVIKNIDGIPLEPLSFYKECETGCDRAIPDNEQFVKIMNDLIMRGNAGCASTGSKVREAALKNYDWKKTAEKWKSHFENIELKPLDQTWQSQPRLFEPAKSMPENIVSILDKVNFLFTDVLHKPEWMGSFFWRKVLKDCTFGYKCQNLSKDFYFNESHNKSHGSMQPFSIDEAFKEMTHFRNQLNDWELARHQKNLRKHK